MAFSAMRSKKSQLKRNRIVNDYLILAVIVIARILYSVAMVGAVQQISLEKEYEKDNDITTADIQKLRAWLDTQPHLPGKYLTELDLIVTYHCCERSMQVSKQVLDLHCTLRSADSFAPFFRDRCLDKKVQLALDTILFAPLPILTVRGYRAIYLRLLDADARNFFLPEAARTFVMVFDLWQYQEGTWPGFVMIIDMDQTTMSHIKKLEIMTVKKILYYLQECMLIKLKEVHFRNAPHFMDKLMMLLRPFLKKELLDIIYIHPSGDDGIYKYIPKEAFPVEDGGTYKTREAIQAETIERFQANAAFFQEENKKRVDETKRPGGKSSVLDAFGIQGSFKKLELD